MHITHKLPVRSFQNTVLSAIRTITDSLAAYSVVIAPHYKNHMEEVHTTRDKIQSLVMLQQLAHITNCGFQNAKISFIFRYSLGDLQWFVHNKLKGRGGIYTKF